VPPSFQEIVDECYENLGCPLVTIESFWEVYIALRDRVDDVIPLSLSTDLNQSIFSEPGEAEDIQFTLNHLKAPELDMRNAVEVDEDGEVIDEDGKVVDEDGVEIEGEEGGNADEENAEEGEIEDLFLVSFTMDNGQDQLF
jgi:hypothetical protein